MVCWRGGWEGTGKQYAKAKNRGLPATSSKSCRPDCWQILSTRTYSYAAAAAESRRNAFICKSRRLAEGWPQPREFRDRFADMNAPLGAGSALPLPLPADDGWIINDRAAVSHRVPPPDPSMSRAECLTTPGVVLTLIASLSGSGHVHREFLRPPPLSFLSPRRSPPPSLIVLYRFEYPQDVFSISFSCKMEISRLLKKKKKVKNTPTKVDIDISVTLSLVEWKYFVC